MDYFETLAIACSTYFFVLSAPGSASGAKKKMSIRILSSHVGGAQHATYLVLKGDFLRGCDVEAATVLSMWTATKEEQEIL